MEVPVRWEWKRYRHAFVYLAAEVIQRRCDEVGADFMLQGQIDSILDSVDGQTVRYYQVELELIDIESNAKTWIGQKKLKKPIVIKLKTKSSEIQKTVVLKLKEPKKKKKGKVQFDIYVSALRYEAKIKKPRLKAMPSAKLCLECQIAEEEGRL